MINYIPEFEKILNFSEFLIRGLGCSFPLIPKPLDFNIVEKLPSFNIEDINSNTINNPGINYTVNRTFEFIQHCTNIIKLHDSNSNLYLPYDVSSNSRIIKKYNLDELKSLLIDGVNFKKGGPDFVLFDNNQKCIKEMSQYKVKIGRDSLHSKDWFIKNYNIYSLKCDYLYLTLLDEMLLKEQYSEIPPDLKYFFKIDYIDLNFLEKETSIKKLKDYDSFLNQVIEKYYKNKKNLDKENNIFYLSLKELLRRSDGI